MPAEQLALILRYPPSLSDDELSEFVEAIKRDGVSLTVDREKPGVYAGIEWLLPTFVTLFIAQFFQGFVQEAGTDAYRALKKGAVRLWMYLSTVHVTIVGSSPGKLARHERYSRVFSVMARGQSGTIKLLIRHDATEDGLAAAWDAFFRFIDSPEQTGALRYHGRVAIVTYDADTDAIRAVDLNER